MTINKDDFYLQDISLLKQLQPIMAKKGIDNDAWLLWEHDPSKASVCLYAPYAWLKSYCSTWRKDSLESTIRKHWGWITHMAWAIRLQQVKWVLEKHKVVLSSDLQKHIVDLYKTIVITDDIQESLKALAQLIILLDKENIE